MLAPPTTPPPIKVKYIFATYENREEANKSDAAGSFCFIKGCPMILYKSALDNQVRVANVDDVYRCEGVQNDPVYLKLVANVDPETGGQIYEVVRPTQQEKEKAEETYRTHLYQTTYDMMAEKRLTNALKAEEWTQSIPTTIRKN